MRKLITVRNNTKQSVIRANLLFPAGGVVQISLDTDTSKFKEIKACSSLKVLQYEDIPLTYEESVFKVDVDKSAVVPPEVSTKAEEPKESVVVEEVPAEVVEAVVAPPAPPEPEVDVVPVVVSPEKPLPDVAELEVSGAEEEKSEVVSIISCPYCNFTSASKTGVFHHVRTKHPDNYEEYRERLKKL